MRKIFYILLVGILFSGIILKFDWNQNNLIQSNTLKIGNTEIVFEVASTPEELEKGLSGRMSLEEGRGMLFVFKSSNKYGFWMKDMNFALDIIWIREDGVIVGIEKDVQPDTYPRVYYPKEEVKYILEVPSGFANRHNVRVGETLSIGQINP